MVNWSNWLVSLKAQLKVGVCDPIQFKGLLVYKVALAKGKPDEARPTVVNEKSLGKEKGSWEVTWGDDKAMFSGKSPECGQGPILWTPWTLTHLAKVKVPSLEMTQKDFGQYNIGPSKQGETATQ